MSLIDSITDVKVTTFLSLPPQYLFSVEGTTKLSSWKHVEINGVVHILQPADGIQEFEVAIEPTDDAVTTNAIQSVKVSTPILFLKEWAVGVRFKSATNSVDKLLVGTHKKIEIDIPDLAKMLYDDTPGKVLNFLKGRKLRVLKPGDLGTTEIDPGRVTIQVNDGERIESVKIDPEQLGA